jgi:hypothetical protein
MDWWTRCRPTPEIKLGDASTVALRRGETVERWLAPSEPPRSSGCGASAARAGDRRIGLGDQPQMSPGPAA